MIGRLVSGRYLIEEKVGTGGMAVVYRARDTQTDQWVAIKVLRPEYETDMDFVLRFGREAEAAAKVSHENIVNLLDVGIDGEMRYIVMEYVDGSTLKEMILDEGKIHPDVALRMTIRILAAVDHAHRNGIVHRDIKPQNILVDRDGRVKVADFGIARLKAEQAAQADADGNAMGSVHYISPEQARGELADEQSDLYSVGVVLYEMLTGGVPFDGKTSMEVALKHVNAEARSMRSIDPHISKALDEVVTRALCKDKTRRYQTAAEMAADLRMTLTHPRGGFVRYPEAKESPEAREAQARKKRQRKEAQKKAALRLLVLTGILFAIAALAVLGIYIAHEHSGFPMPDVRGIPEAAAVQILEDMKLKTSVVHAYSENYEASCVMMQSIEADARVRRNDEAVLTISLGTQWFDLPEMTGWPVDEAAAYLAEAGAANVSVEYVQSAQTVGTVASVDHTPGKMNRDEPVTLRISGQSVTVPMLIGLTQEGAQAVLEAEGLRLGEVAEGETRDAKFGSVIEQSIAPYTQTLTGTAIDLTVCRAQEIRYAPDSPLTLVVPLNGIRVSITLTTPSGQSIEAFAGEMDAGTHQTSLTSSEPGLHSVHVHMDDVLFETFDINFE